MARSTPSVSVIRRHRGVLIALAIVEVVGWALSRGVAEEVMPIGIGFHLVWLTCLWILAGRFSLVAILVLILVGCFMGFELVPSGPTDVVFPGLWVGFAAHALAAGYGVWLAFGDLFNWSRVPGALDDIAAGRP